jgi:hypothetical protein
MYACVYVPMYLSMYQGMYAHTCQYSSTYARMRRSSIGSNCIFGDTRWGGYYGIEAEFVAADNCKIVAFDAEDVKVRLSLSALSLSLSLSLSVRERQRRNKRKRGGSESERSSPSTPRTSGCAWRGWRRPPRRFRLNFRACLPALTYGPSWADQWAFLGLALPAAGPSVSGLSWSLSYPGLISELSWSNWRAVLV